MNFCLSTLAEELSGLSTKNANGMSCMSSHNLSLLSSGQASSKARQVQDAFARAAMHGGLGMYLFTMTPLPVLYCNRAE